MATNLKLYPKRASLLMPRDMTEQRFMEGFDRTNMLVNCFVGVANEVARLAISDGMALLEKSRYYRHNIKRWSRETFRRQEAYEYLHSQNFGDRTQLWLDYLDAVENEFRPHIFNVFMSLKQVMDGHRQSDSLLKAKLECGRVCATLAVAQFDVLMADEKQRWGVDYTSMFMPARYDGPLQTWTYICECLVKDEHPESPMSLTEDKNCQLAYDILARKLNDESLINRIGAVAIHYNLDVARKYASPDDISELEERFGKKE